MAVWNCAKCGATRSTFALKPGAGSCPHGGGHTWKAAQDSIRRQDWYCRTCGKVRQTTSLRPDTPPDPPHPDVCHDRAPHKWAKKKPPNAPVLRWVCKYCGRTESSRDKPPADICRHRSHVEGGYLKGPGHQWKDAATFNWTPWK